MADIRDVKLSTLIDVIKKSSSKREVLRYFGIKSNNGNQSHELGYIITKNDIDIQHFSHYKNYKNYKNYKKIIDFLPSCKNFKEVGIKLGVAYDDPSKPMSANNYVKIKRAIQRYKLDVSHFEDKNRYNKSTVRYTFNDVFCINSKVSKVTTKKRYIEYRINNKISVKNCDLCNYSKWMNKDIPLQLDHINGINDDNRIKNLRLLCPNCHAMTDTFAGKRNK